VVARVRAAGGSREESAGWVVCRSGRQSFCEEAILLYRESDESATAVAPRLELAPETFRTPRRKTIEA